MKLDFDTEYKLTLKDIIMLIVLSVIVGAILWIVSPLFVFTIIVLAVCYVAVTLYYGIKGRSKIAV